MPNPHESKFKTPPPLGDSDHSIPLQDWLLTKPSRVARRGKPSRGGSNPPEDAMPSKSTGGLRKAPHPLEGVFETDIAEDGFRNIL